MGAHDNSQDGGDFPMGKKTLFSTGMPANVDLRKAWRMVFFQANNRLKDKFSPRILKKMDLEILEK